MIKLLILFPALIFSLTVTMDNSPFMVDSSMVLDTFKVEAGASVFFKQGSSLRITKYLSLVGKLNSDVVLASSEASPTPFDWKGITLDSSAKAFINHAHFSHCVNCINSATDSIQIDSTFFTDFGETKVRIGALSVGSTSQEFFRFKPGPSKEPVIQNTKSYKKKLIIGSAALVVIGAGVGITLYLKSPTKKSDVKDEPQINTPNLPNLN